jgi:hypothetical protein
MAHIVAGFSKEKSIHLVPSLALSKGDPASDIIRSAFEESEFPITNLRMLFDKGKSVKHAVMERAEQSRKFIAETFENEQAQKALVIGHDILIQALCTQFFGDVMLSPLAIGPFSRDTITGTLPDCATRMVSPLS